MHTEREHTSLYRQIIRFFRQREKQDTPETIDRVWNEITRQVAKDKVRKQRKQFLLYGSSVAALIAGLFFGIPYFYSTDTSSVLYQLAEQWTHEETEEIRLVIANNEQITLPSDTIVTYTRKKSSIEIIKEEETPEESYDRVIVPKGKRIQLVLSDGTKMWVNSGTRVIYPQKFTGNKREIYTDGEIYLEVTPDKERPFIVRTDLFEVEVLGTSFNICAYKRFTQSVVLAEGSVHVKHTTGKSQILQPNEQILIEEDQLGQPIEVNADDHICWINNLLIFRSVPLDMVFKKLHLYYDFEFILDGDFTDITLSGKMDLKDDLFDIVRLITKTAPINYTIQNNTIVFTNKDR